MQRLLATAGVVMLASLVPANAPDDRTSATRNTTAPDAVTQREAPALHDIATKREASTRLVPAITATGRTQTDDAAAEPASAATNAVAPSQVAPHVAPLTDTLAGRLPSLAALDAAFDNRAVELPPVPIPSRRPPTYAEMCETLASAASAHSLPAPFMIRLIWQESRFRHNVISHAGAQGIAQFMPETATLMGLDDPFDPLEALPVSARFLRKLLERFGNIGLAAAAYNAGPRRVLDWLAGKGELPKETQDYVKTVTGQPAEKWRKPEATATLPRLPSRAPCQREAGLYAANGPDHIPLPPDAPDRNPERTLLAAADAAPADNSKVASKVTKAEHKSVQLAAMRKVKKEIKEKAKDEKKAAAGSKADRKNPDKKAAEKRDEKSGEKPDKVSVRKKTAGKTTAEPKSANSVAKAAKKFATADAH